MFTSEARKRNRPGRALLGAKINRSAKPNVDRWERANVWKAFEKALLEVVDNKLRDGEPVCAKEAFARIKELGCSSSRAKEIIAIAVSDEIFTVMKHQQEYDERQYEARVWDLVERYERGLPFYDE